MKAVPVLRAASYARYSTQNQDGNSIAYQFNRIAEYCQKNDIKLVAHYADEAQSGTNTENRPEFLRMISDAGKGLFDAVVIYDITRGSRDVADWFEFRKTMRMLGVRVISVNDNLGDILDPSAFLQELIGVGIGQHQVLTSRAKSLDGVAVKAKQGAFLGGYAPYGYKIIDQQYHIVPSEAEVVRKIFQMYADGAGYGEIIKTIGPVMGRRGRPIGENTLHFMLKNERYTGVYIWNAHINRVMRKWVGGKPNPNIVRIEGAIPAIIDKATWERVQSRMSERKNNARYKAKRQYLLSGIIVCAACGSHYVGHTSTNKKGFETRYYVCGNKYRTRTCKAKNINANQIEEFVMLQLNAFFAEENFTAYASTIADIINSASPNLEAEKRELLEVSEKIKNGMNAILSGLVLPELQDELARLRSRKSELETIIAKKESCRQKANPAKIEMLLRNAHAQFRSNDYASVRRAVELCVPKIEVDPDGSYTVHIGVVHTIGSPGRDYVVYTTAGYKVS